MAYNLPALNWLAKKDPEAALAVFHRLRGESCNLGAESDPGYLDPRDRSSDDMETHVVPDEPVISETMAEPVQDGPDEVWPEMLHEESPSERDICLALGWIEWPNSRPRRSEPVGWCMRCHCGKIAPAEGALSQMEVAGRYTITIGRLTYNSRPEARRGRAGGMLISWIDASGTERRPTFRANRPRGGKRPHRVTPARYLALPAAIDHPMDAVGYQRPISCGPALMPMLNPLGRRAPDASLDIYGQIDAYGRYGVAEGRALLESLGVDGAVPFGELPFPATRCSPAIARGARFIGGISGRSQTASSGVIGKAEEPVKVAAKVEEVLDEVAARGTLESIGIRIGYRGGYADRAGGKALLAAGKALISANDDTCKKVAA